MSIKEETRKVFDEHHREQANDTKLFKRLTSLISTEYFQVDDDFFKNKKVLDMGCGSNANASYAFLELEAKQVVSADLGNKWMPCAYEKLAKFKDRSVLDSQNVLSLTYSDNTFDFVHCAGVLHHTTDPEGGFKELARVTKPKGIVFITIMANGKGIIYEWINLLRTKYKEDKEFRELVDNLTIEKLNKNIDWLLAEKEQYEGCTDEERTFVKSLFNNDFVLTIKDRLQAPTYHAFDFTEEQIRKWFEDAGFKDIKRITRYTKGFENMRKYLAPLYYHYQHPLAKLLFGDGYVQMMGVKK